MNKSCKQCSANFEITQDDLAFYDKVSPVFNGKKYQIPTPTFCPDCRQQRRLSFRNERKLYKRSCDLCKKNIVSIYSPDKPYTVYCQECWWSDKWNPLDYGKEFDFNSGFFEQFAELMKVLPRCNMIIQNCTNSDYTNYSANNENCYICVSSHRCKDTYFCYRCHDLDDCIDCINVNNSSACYETIDSENCFKISFSQLCNDCSESIFLFNCKGCSNCMFCMGLKNKSYNILNKQYSKEEYFEKKSKLENKFSDMFIWLKEQYYKNFLEFPRINLNKNECENCLGDYLFNSKNLKNAYFVQNSQDSSYLFDGRNVETSMDLTNPDDMQFCYENSSSIDNYNTYFSYHIGSSKNLYYCDFSMNSENCFGCISLNGNKYCILNKQYTKEEYETLVPKIIEHMIKSGEWGKFFPSSLSPFGYNETVAQEYFPLTKEEALKKGFNWSDYEPPFPKVDKIIPAEKLPDDINKIPDDILNWAIKCEVSGKPYKIVKQELEFYRKHNIPIPRRHPDQRHLDRMKLRNPRKLYSRNCMKCNQSIQTTYAPNRPKIVYCEECYLKEVY